ncbi:MAG: hypothetical protein M1829_006039 [Trizodia sp. TS-e1964]|nr:MAG: hypothetical protein M1829_006039 [Trizodia sp. TS-e1964]
MDEFAQTRAPDDLFDDDFTPLSEVAASPMPSSHRGQSVQPPRDQGGRAAKTNESTKESASNEAVEETEKIEDTAKEAAKPPASVRGDRSGTGGVKKVSADILRKKPALTPRPAQPKLTEDELTQRLASIKLKNAAREAAHARAEADEASFQQREQIEQSKRLEESQNRRALDGEREKNRLRKLKTVQGREWDAEKPDEPPAEPQQPSSPYPRRGFRGGETRSYAARDSGGTQYHSSRGDGRDPALRGARGGYGRPRGAGRGRGRGRAGFFEPAQQRVGPGVDFPALPAVKDSAPAPKSQEERQPQKQKLALGADGTADSVSPDMSLQSPGVERGTWADQVEAGLPITPA